MQRRSFKSAIAPAAGNYTARISTNTLDADGEVLLPAGCDATEFEKRGTVFWNHDYNKPIGKLMQRLHRNDDGVDATFAFATRPDTHSGEWFPDTVRSLVDQRVVRGVSVGFDPVSARGPTADELVRHGDRLKRVYSAWKLLEFSLAPLQSNPDALVLSGKALAPSHVKAMRSAVDALPAPDPGGLLLIYRRKPREYRVMQRGTSHGLGAGTRVSEDALIVTATGTCYRPGGRR